MSTEKQEMELCPTCGSAPSVTYGPDYRFSPPSTSPKMWTAQCGGNCFDLSKTWTAFTRVRALEMWNNGVRATLKQGATT